MIIREQFDDPQCAALAALAETKNYEAVLDNAADYFDDGTANESAEVLSGVYEDAIANYPPKTPIWAFWLGETRVYYIGTYADVHTLLNSLP